MHRTLLRLATAILVLASAAASAHPGHEGASLVHALMHTPDHMIAVVGAGLMAAHLGGWALWGLCRRVLSPR
jgi:hydrogenase/urease accessory protein HupE